MCACGVHGLVFSSICAYARGVCACGFCLPFLALL